MIDPVRQRQLDELEEVQICHDILTDARNELYLNFRYLDLALGSLGFEADPTALGVACDGFLIYYRPGYLLGLYEQGRVFVNRAFLHMVFHCMFCHLDTRGEREEEYWNLACDIAIESILDEFYSRCVYRHQSPYRREVYRLLREKQKVLTAEAVYHELLERRLTKEDCERMAAEFFVDSHERWEQRPEPEIRQERQNEWQKIREKLQTEMESMGVEEAENSEGLLENVRVENRERYDYRKFLKRFSVFREELMMDYDSFDYGLYQYGMSLYGNIPLMEPLESKEVSRIEDFVIVVDTSMSCSGQLVKRFLEETYDILNEAESYFRKINVHIIQCDEQIRSDVTVTSQEEMKEYMENFTISGQGGTDFRPAFEYVNGLQKTGVFRHLRGLIYFTDGKGIYPVRQPVYDTAFLFVEGEYEAVSVPPWAIKIILTKEELEEAVRLKN